MPTLFHIFNMGSESLANSRMGVDVTGHNMANAHTAGFSKQRVDVRTKDPVSVDNVLYGSGAKVASIERSHDSFIESQVRRETIVNGFHESLTYGLGKLEDLFNPELTSTIHQRMTEFRNSLRDLSNFPEEPAFRTSLAESAETLTRTFKTNYGTIVQIQDDLTNEMEQDLSALNQKLQELSDINQHIVETASQTQKANDFLDRRDVLVKEVGRMMNIKTYEGKWGELMIRGPGDTLLLDGTYAAKLGIEQKTIRHKSGIYIQQPGDTGEKVITDKISSGRLAGMLQTRDKYAQGLKENLNHMALTFGNEFNAIHSKGFGIAEHAEKSGRNFFSGLDGAEGEPAEAIRVSTLVLSDPYSISAALNANSTGDNIVANELVKVFDKPLFDENQSDVSNFYEKFVGNLGIDSMRAKQDQNASNILLSQLNSQRDAVSGVSLDEEAANLMKYQHLFDASSRLITTADEMMQTVIGLKR